MTPMLRIVLGGIGLLVLGAGVLVYLFFRWNTPSTELVDASGAALTSGLPVPVEPESEPESEPEPEPGTESVPGTVPASAPAAPRLFAGPEFAEPQRLITARNHSQAKEALLVLLESSDRDGETCILLSEVCRELEEFDEAVDYGLKAVELLPDVGRAHHMYAKALALKMMKGDNRLAAMVLLPKWRDELAAAIELEPDNVDARLEQLTFYTYMPSVIGGDLDRAIELCAELEPYDPAKGKLWMALAYQRKEEPERAIELCQEGMAAFPEDGMFACTLGSLHAEAERYDEADAAFEEARKIRGSEAYYRALVSQAMMHVDHELDREKAVTLLDEYVAYDADIPLMPPNAMAHFKRGQALEQLGRTDEARAAYEACLREEPRYSQAQDALDALGS